MFLTFHGRIINEKLQTKTPELRALKTMSKLDTYNIYNVNRCHVITIGIGLVYISIDTYIFIPSKFLLKYKKPRYT